MILTPEYIFKTIECIHPDFLAAHGIKALVLDVDNTLTADNSQVLEPTVQAWLDEMRAAGIRLTIVSNNTAKRVRAFAERIGLDWVPLASKNAPMEAAMPTQMVETSHLIYFMVSWMAIPSVMEPPGLLR